MRPGSFILAAPNPVKSETGTRSVLFSPFSYDSDPKPLIFLNQET